MALLKCKKADPQSYHCNVPALLNPSCYATGVWACIKYSDGGWF